MSLRLSDLKSFLTGSHAYGTPHEQSDVDLVVLVTPQDLETLAVVRKSLGRDLVAAEADDYGGGTGVTANIHFGRLNLIVCTCYQDFEVWKRGTEELAARKPVSRTEAVEHFRTLRAEAKALKEFVL